MKEKKVIENIEKAIFLYRNDGLSWLQFLSAVLLLVSDAIASVAMGGIGDQVIR